MGLEVERDINKIKDVVRQVIESNPKAVSDALKNPKAINFLVGQVMRALKGRADPRTVRMILEEELGMSARHGTER